MADKIIFSIVISAFNRENCIARAVNSARNFLSNEFFSEIIVVDDGSTDNTVTVVEKLISSINGGPKVFLIKHNTNKGVCAAKNTGANAALGAWLIFLDSDDELIADSNSSLYAVLKQNEQCPIHFFSCSAENKIYANKMHSAIKVNFKQYIRSGTLGEKLPVIKRSVFSQYPYDEDMPGYEGLSYMRIIKKHGFACIYSFSVRRYYTSNQDRLSTRAGFWKRCGKLAIGHLRVISEHHEVMTITGIILYCLRFIKSIVLWGVWRLIIKGRSSI